MPNKFEMISGGRINKDTVEIVVIIDKSGSMARIKNTAIDGFNAFVEEQQKAPGKANMTVILFSHGNDYRTLEEYTPVKDVKLLDESTYVPQGGTALLDAIGRTVDDTLSTFSNIPPENIPEKVIFAILTDGDERDSIKYKRSDILQKIKDQEEKGWQFNYLSAGKDAIKDSASFGIKSGNTMQFQADDVGIRSAYSTMSSSITSYRSDAMTQNTDSKLPDETD